MGEGALGKLIAAFCDSPYIVQNAYEETLMELERPPFGGGSDGEEYE